MHFRRPVSDSAPLPHLWSEDLAARGSIDIRMQMYLQSVRMRENGDSPNFVSDSRFTDSGQVLVTDNFVGLDA